MTKPLTTSHLLLALALAMLFSCSSLEFDNPLDPNCKGSKCNTSVSSSSSEVSSSSFEEGSSSSSEYVSSSSGEQGSSSSEAALSSSSVESSSSSDEQSSSSVELSSSSSLKGCKDMFSDNTHFCYDGTVYRLCGSAPYGAPYNPTTHICQESGVAKYAECNSENYNPLIYDCCNNSVLFYKETQRCNNNIVETKCGNGWYDPATHFCTKSENNPKAVELCGGRGYDTKKYFCDARDEGKLYKYVEIGMQTWMAENLNCNTYTFGSKCYNNEPANCDKYGKLYDWAMAMDLPVSCNSTSCSEQVDGKHRGICPSGWHIPSNEDWTMLINYVHGEIPCNSCAGTHLKAVSGWASWSGITKLDTYGFSALPGNFGDYDGSFGDYDGVPSSDFGLGNIGYSGYWWSSNESNEYSSKCWSMNYKYNSVGDDNYDKSSFRSVRCVMDDL